jgi:hypothetical protein
MTARREKELEALAAEIVASGFTDAEALTRLKKEVLALPIGTPRPRGKYINIVIEALR